MSTNDALIDSLERNIASLTSQSLDTQNKIDDLKQAKREIECEEDELIDHEQLFKQLNSQPRSWDGKYAKAFHDHKDSLMQSFRRIQEGTSGMLSDIESAIRKLENRLYDLESSIQSKKRQLSEAKSDE